MNNKTPTVWITMTENGRKDFSEAKNYGNLRVVFTRTIYNDDNIDPVNIAVHEMRDYEDGDFILTSGDPMAAAIVAEVALANSINQRLTFLRWDRRTLKYNPYTVDFGGL
jgi:hypothetical protein